MNDKSFYPILIFSMGKFQLIGTPFQLPAGVSFHVVQTKATAKDLETANKAVKVAQNASI